MRRVDGKLFKAGRQVKGRTCYSQASEPRPAPIFPLDSAGLWHFAESSRAISQCFNQDGEGRVDRRRRHQRSSDYIGRSRSRDF